MYLDITKVLTHAERPNKEFGSWSEHYDISYGHIATYNPPYGGYEYAPHVGAKQELRAGDTFWAIIAVWSTGNSFGRAENGNIDVLQINADADLAFKNLNKLK